ncbi:MAG: hypothetical protein ACFCD0_26885 [Gemmataceae bacterium]
MRLLTGLSFLAWLAIPVGASSDEAASQSVEVVYWGETPKLFRLDIRINGEPPNQLFRSVVADWVRYCDRDSDGKLNALEIRNMPDATSFASILRNGYYYPRNTVGLDITTFGKSPQEKVSVDDLVAHYSANPRMASIQLSPSLNRPRSTSSSKRWLFEAIDTNDDRKLSKQELTAGIELIRKYDANDDEMLIETEIPGAPMTTGVAVRPTRRIPSVPIVLPSFELVLTAADRAKLPEMLLVKYDRDKNGGLTQKELGLSKEQFSKLDADQDGVLTLTETKIWRNVVQVTQVQLPIGTAGMMGMKKPNKETRKPTFLEKIRKRNNSFRVGNANIAFRVTAPILPAPSAQANYYIRLFQMANPKKKKYLTMVDLIDRRYTYLRKVFPLFDKNGDRKITEAEIQRFWNLLQRSRNQYVSVKFQSEGRKLFTVIDGNRDGRLTMRELLSAWDDLKTLDFDKDEQISEQEFPKEFTVYVSQGRIYSTNNPYTPRPVSRTSYRGNGPLWFQRMDTNGDGDVSAREFLGDRGIFDRLDADKDGLIDAIEATKAQKSSSS